MELRTLLGEWQKAIVSEGGPASSTTRLVLLALSTRMDSRLTAIVTVESLAAMSGVSEKSVQTHLKRAAADGWVESGRVTRDGRSWFITRYTGKFPGDRAKERPKKPNKGDEMKFKTSGPVMIASSEAGDWDGFIVPGTNSQVLVVTKDGIYWHFFAAASGAELQVWDERPEVLAEIHAWQKKEGWPFIVQDVHLGLEVGKEIYDAATDAAVPLYSSDEAEVKAALAKVDFIVIDDYQPVLCRRYSKPKAARRVTQKILDGGQDMTTKGNA